MTSLQNVNIGNNTLIEWLSNPPKFTTFRVNKLRNVDIKTLASFLKTQADKLNQTNVPNYYFLRPDCLILQQWPNMKYEKSGNEVIVDAACAAAVLRGAHVYAPGVIGLYTNCKLEDKVDIYGDLEGKCKKGLKVKYDGIKIFVGSGQLKMLRHELFTGKEVPSGIAVHTVLPASRLPVVNESLYPKGNVLLQNLPSIVCGWVMNAQPNEKILDMCAAPGNKTTHLAEMSHDKAFIIAMDKTVEKVERIKANALAHGLSCIKTYAFDSTKCYSDINKGILDGPPYPENSFDKVLLDAPCSGLGQRPQLLNKMSAKMLSSYKFVQRKLLNAAVKVMKVGGRLVYSTCTVNKEENEEVVAWALKEFSCLKLIPAEPLLGGPGWSGCGLTDQQRVLIQRFGPEDDKLRTVDPIYRDTIGFFIACFTKEDHVL